MNYTEQFLVSWRHSKKAWFSVLYNVKIQDFLQV